MLSLRNDNCAKTEITYTLRQILRVILRFGHHECDLFNVKIKNGIHPALMKHSMQLSGQLNIQKDNTKVENHFRGGCFCSEKNYRVVNRDVCFGCVAFNAWNVHRTC